VFTKNIAAPNKTKIFASLVGLLLVLLMLMTGITPASATTTVIISPSTQIVSQGESFSINVSIEPDTAIAGAQFNLQFNSSIINVNSVMEGELFKQNGANTLFNPGTIDNVAGVVTHVWGNILNTSGAPKNVSTSGTFAIINITACNTAAGPSPLALIGKPPISVLVSDPEGNAVPISVINGTVKVNRAPEPSDTSPPIVTTPNATLYLIPDDTDNDPRWGETSQLNVTITDDSSILSVTINLSQIGGSSVQPMTNIGGNIWSVTTNASANTARWTGTAYEPYCLQVNATDFYGNSNTSVSIELMVMKNGDVTSDGIVDFESGIRIINHDFYPEDPTYSLPIDTIADVTGDGIVDFGDGIRIINHDNYPEDPSYILK